MAKDEVEREINICLRSNEIEELVNEKVKKRALFIVNHMQDEELDELANNLIKDKLELNSWQIHSAINEFINRGDIVQVIVKI